MATYQELFGIAENTAPALAQRITVAIVVKAQTIVDDPASTTPLLEWADKALRNPTQDYQAVLNYMLAANKSATVNNINNSNDTAVQNNVNTAVENLLGA